MIAAIIQEQWKPIAGYEGHYEVSNLGRVRTLNRQCKCSERISYTIEEKILYFYWSSSGYKQTNLRKDGGRKVHLIHRLVAQAFIPNPLNKDIVNHKDRDRTNNSVLNLEWMSASENACHWMRIDGILKRTTSSDF